VFLLALAGLAAWDAGHLTLTSTYGMGPEAMPYVIAGGLAALAIGHFVVAVRSALPEREPFDLRAIGWIAAGLLALIVVIGVGGGFVIAMTLLFAATARAFGRTAVVTDLLIGLGLGILAYLMFSKLLTLSLPQGPLEALF
jgi:putative tricarboxylic transport membrane protein